MGAVRAHPRAAGGRQPLELAVLQGPVGADVHVRVPGQLLDVRHDRVVDQAVRVVRREQAGPPRRRHRGRQPGDAPGEWQQPAVPAVEQVVDERVGGGLGLVGGVEVLRPVPPHVEVEARVAQRPPTAAAEVVDRLGAALGLGLVVRQVAGLVDRSRQPYDGDLAAPALPDGRLAGGGKVEGVHALGQRPPQQGLGRLARLARRDPRRHQPGPGGREVGRGHAHIIPTVAP